MDEKQARLILSDTIQDDGSLSDSYDYTDWQPYSNGIILDGHFTADYLEAVAWWMRNKKEAD